MLDRFDMDLAYPSLPANTWVTAMLRLFRPTVEHLVATRDTAVASWQASHHDVNVYEDRDLEVTSYADISVESQIEAVLRALEID